MAINLTYSIGNDIKTELHKKFGADFLLDEKKIRDYITSLIKKDLKIQPE